MAKPGRQMTEEEIKDHLKVFQDIEDCIKNLDKQKKEKK